MDDPRKAFRLFDIKVDKLIAFFFAPFVQISKFTGLRRSSGFPMKLAKNLLFAALIVFVLMQFYRPPLNESGPEAYAVFEEETQPNQEIRTLLESACYDCHSDHTRYPWYNQIAPVSYWLAQHVDEGKEHLNFSDWESYSPKKKDHKLEEIAEEVKGSEMPLREYTWTHEQARLTPEQRKLLVEWAEELRTRYSRVPPQDRVRQRQLSGL